MTIQVEVKALSFDADQTLWDFRGVHQRALQATVDAMVARGDVADGDVDVSGLQTVREEVVERFRGRPHDLAEVRRLSFEVFLVRAQHRNAALASRELAEIFFDVRFNEIQMYPEVAASLQRLKRRLPIGLLSNGNTDPDRCGLPDVFDAVILAPELGFEKPDPRTFAAVAAGLDVAVESLLHVGDDWDDVDGANAVGATSVFIARPGTDTGVGDAADHRIADLVALEALLDEVLG